MSDAASLQALGASHLARGRFDEAIAAFRRHVQLHPRDAQGWIALAHCLVVSSRAPAALIAYDAALELEPQSVQALCGKARVLQGQSRIEPAEALFRTALDAQPRSPEALLGLAKLAVDAGDWTAAEAWAEQLGAVSNGAEHAWLTARVSFGLRRFAETERRIQTLLTEFNLDPLQRADALLLLNLALDELGRTAEAFGAAVKGKAAQRRFYAERAAGREAEPEKLARLGEWFASCDPAPWRVAPAGAEVDGASDTHVFLLGFPRSGTTLLEQALAGLPDVVALEEAPTLAQPYAEFLTGPEGLARLSKLSSDEARVWRARYWRDLKAFGLGEPASVFVDKNPAGTLYLPLIAKLFPCVKVLFALRDPRDVVLSCLRNNFQMNAMTYAFTELQEAASCYDACMRMAEIYRRVLPLDVLEVRHEALVADLDGELQAVCRFIGVEPRLQMLDIAATARRRPVRTPSAPQLREGLNAKGVGRWRAYAAELAPVLPRLAPWVSRFGYGEGD